MASNSIASDVFSKYLMSDESLIDFIPHAKKSELYLGLTNKRLLVITKRKGETMSEIPLEKISGVSTCYRPKRYIGVGILLIIIGIFLIFIIIGILFIIRGIAIVYKSKVGRLFIQVGSRNYAWNIEDISSEELGKFASKVRETAEKRKKEIESMKNPSPQIVYYQPPPPPPPSVQQQVKPFVDAIGMATIKSNGEILLKIHATTPTTLLSARIDGTNYYSSEITPNSIPPGDTDVKVKVTPIPVELNPDVTYNVILTAESLGNKFEIHIPGRYNF